MPPVPSAGKWQVTGWSALAGWLRATAGDSGTFPTLANPEEYVALTSGALAYEGTTFFTLSNFGVLTYSGPNAFCVIDADISIFGTLNVAQDSDAGFGISKNGDLVGVQTVGNAAAALGAGFARYLNALSDNYLQLSALRGVTLTAGDTLTGVVGVGAAGKFSTDVTLGTLGMLLTLFPSG